MTTYDAGDYKPRTRLQGSHCLGYKKNSTAFPGPFVSQQCLNVAINQPGDRCKLPQQGPGRIPGRESTSDIPAAQKTVTIMAIFIHLKPKTATHITT